MGKLAMLVALVSIGAGMAFGYTFPAAFPYDGLATFDHAGLPIVPNAVHLNVGAGYLMASQMYDKDGNALDMLGDQTIIAAPIDIGYSFNENILADVTVQVISTKFAPDAGGEASAAGLGDVWVKGRYIAPMDGWNLGGRLGVKVPVGKVDYADTDPELGDDQIDIDVAAVGGTFPDAGFAFNGQLGFRYRMKYTMSVPSMTPGQTIDVDYTPGMLIYLDVEPGYTMGPDNFQIYVPIGYEMSMAAKSDSTTVTDSETSGLYVGVAPKYGIDANNTLGLKFLYPIMGTNVMKAMLVGLTYEGYIPL